jgi:urea-proton symporter
MLLLGGSAVINALTGMNIYAAAFLIPIGIIMCESPCLVACL